MYFLDDAHLDEFLKLVSAYHKERSREFVAAYYLLTSDKEIRQRALDSISSNNGNIETSILLGKNISVEKKEIIRLALHLFRESGATQFSDLIVSNEKLCKLTAQAFEIRKNWPRCC